MKHAPSLWIPPLARLSGNDSCPLPILGKGAVYFPSGAGLYHSYPRAFWSLGQIPVMWSMCSDTSKLLRNPSYNRQRYKLAKQHFTQRARCTTALQWQKVDYWAKFNLQSSKHFESHSVRDCSVHQLFEQSSSSTYPFQSSMTSWQSCFKPGAGST